MITVSQAVMDEFLSPAQKNLRLRFSDGTVLNNADIYTETMNLEQAICTEEQLRFGAVNSACFKVQIKGTAKRYKGLNVTPYIFTQSGGVTLGEFTIVNDELSDNREYRSLTAYDALNEVFEKDLSTWYTRLNLPMSLRNFRNSLFSTLGISQEAVTLPNDAMVVERTVSTTDAVLSGKKVLESICEINGCFGAMVYSTTANRSVFRYVTIKDDDSLYPRNNLYPSDTLYPHQGDVLIASENDILQGGLVYQEFSSLPIRRVQLKNTAHDVGATYPNITSGNAYQIIDNFLLYGKNDTQLTTAAQNFFNQVKNITYIPSKATMRGRPWHEVGDLVVVGIKRTSVTFPILRRTLSGITALKDEYEAKGRENYTYSINSVKRQIEQARQKTLEIITTVDELRTTMTERVTNLDGKIETYRSTFQQTAQQIQSTVDAHYSEQTQFQSQITQRADSITTRVTSTETKVSSLESDVDGIETNVTQLQSTITQTASEIRAEVSSATTHAAIVAKINDDTSSVKIKADKVDITGLVTFDDLKTSGRTIINGSNITTGVINANLITTGKIESNDKKTYFDLTGSELITTNGSNLRVALRGGNLEFETRFSPSDPFSVGGRFNAVNVSDSYGTTYASVRQKIGGIAFDGDSSYSPQYITGARNSELQIRSTRGILLTADSGFSAGTRGSGLYIKTSGMTVYDSNDNSYDAYNGTVNGIRFVNGICVGSG